MYYVFIHVYWENGEKIILGNYILLNVHHKIIQVVKNLVLEQLSMIWCHHQLFV
jgi:hypothetical protein